MAAGANGMFVHFRRRSRLLFFGLLFLASGAVSASDEFARQTLEPIDALLASQAWQLALRSIDTAQKEAVAAHWQDLERRRLVVYRNLPDVAALSGRVAALPADTSVDFRRWALEQLLDASFASHDLAHVQTAFDQLLLVSDVDEARRWRKRLVRAYIDSDRMNDAMAAFGPLATDDAERALHAELLVRAGRDREAFERVVGLKSPEAALWRLIAAKRLGLYAPEDVVRELAILVRAFKDRSDLQRIAWLARAEAAGEIGQLARRVNSLEQAFRADPTPAAGLFAATPDDLWSAYFALARYTAHAEDLTLGPAAIARADSYRKRDPYTARALYAWTASDANGADVRAVAHERLVASLTAHDLNQVTRALYAESKRIVVADLPDGVRRALLAEALGRRDLRAAARYVREIEAPPPKESARDWDLRRARLLLYGGEQRAAIELLEHLVTGEDFDAEFARRYLQVVFDLQAMNKHREALALLDSVYTRVDNPRMQRELLFWKAESEAALKHFGEAAELYLHSARFASENAGDRWGQSARFRAAEVLAKAGMAKDAEAVYRGLLKETSDPDQRVLIEQNIERLWLSTPNATKP